MKHEKALSCLTAALMAVCLGFGSVACMVTGLNLNATLGVLGFWCAVGAMVLAIGFSFGRSKIVFGVVGALIGFLALYPDFWSQLFSMLYGIVRYYHQAYGLVIPEWLQDAKKFSHVLPLLVIGVGVMSVTAWTVLRRKRAIFAVAAALVPLASCFVVTDTVPSVFSIFLWLFGLLLLIMTSAVRRRDSVGGLRLTTILALPVAAALLALLTLVPKDEFHGPGQMGNLDSLLSWFSAKLPSFDKTFEGEPVFSFSSTAKSKVELSSLGENYMAKTPVMEVVSEGDGWIYLRGRSYDSYNGKAWSVTVGAEEVLSCPRSSFVDGENELTVKMLAKRGQYYLPYYPSEGVTLQGGMQPNPDYEMEYSFAYRPLRTDWKQRYYPAWPQELAVDSRYLSLPEETRRRAEEHLQALKHYPVPLDTTPMLYLESVSWIQEYVSASARYDLYTGKMPASEQDFAMWFLEQSETGYCVHFATTATVLLRAAGIPARYVEGYVVEAKAHETTVVRENMAHAWVEYFVPEVGWVIMDPTPADGLEPSETQPPTTAPTEPSTEETTQPSTGETEKPTETDPTGSTGGTTEPSVPGDDDRQALPQWFAAMLLWVAGITVFLAALLGQWMLRRSLKLRWLQQGKPNARGLKRYREVLRMAKLRGAPVPDELSRLAEKARFSQHTLTKEELAQFDTFLRDGTRELQRCPWYRQLIYRFVYALY